MCISMSLFITAGAFCLKMENPTETEHDVQDARNDAPNTEQKKETTVNSDEKPNEENLAQGKDLKSNEKTAVNPTAVKGEETAPQTTVESAKTSAVAKNAGTEV